MGKLMKKSKQTQNLPGLEKSTCVFKSGRFTALKVQLQETAINDLVLRVPLTACTGVGFQCKRGPPISQQIPVEGLPEDNEAQHNGYVKSVSLKSLDKNKVSEQLRSGHGLLSFCCVNESVETLLFHSQSKLTLDFMKLSELVCMMKLPSPMWKVTVAVTHDLMTEFKFMNCCSQKCVVFSQTNPNCNIFMDEVPIILLGCPKTIDTIHDMEVLLEIVDRLGLNDCMVHQS